MAKLEAEAFALKQQVAFTQDVKTVLDSWVRQEASIREAEQNKLVTQVIESVKQKLTDPKLVWIFGVIAPRMTLINSLFFVANLHLEPKHR